VGQGREWIQERNSLNRLFIACSFGFAPRMIRVLLSADSLDLPQT
jgi:hypothetical protein